MSESTATRIALAFAPAAAVPPHPYPFAHGGGALIRLVLVGKPRGPLAAAAADYESRVARVLRLEVVEVREEPLQRGTNVEVLERERRRIAPHLVGCAVIALDSGGELVDSEGLARELALREAAPPQRTVFLVGGSLGLAPELVASADRVIALGRVTLPHQLARVVLAEQLYRATTILRREPYHR